MQGRLLARLPIGALELVLCIAPSLSPMLSWP